jgi:hypothetical protein
MAVPVRELKWYDGTAFCLSSKHDVYAMKKNIDFNPTLKNPVHLILVKDVSMR